MSKATFELPEDFFRKNPLPELCTAMLVIFEMGILYESELEENIHSFVLNGMERKRKEDAEKECLQIEASETVDEILKLMRKSLDPLNRNELCKLAISRQNDVADCIIDKLRTSGIDSFIECAVIILTHCADRYIERVSKEFTSFRNSYARAMACALLAYRGRKAALESIYSEYVTMSSSASYEERKDANSVLLAIYALTGRWDVYKKYPLER